MNKPSVALPALFAIALAACQQPAPNTEIAIDDKVNAAEAANAEIGMLPPSEGGGAPAPAGNTATPPAPDLAFNMPQSLRGSWRVDDLDRAPTNEDCNQTSSSNRNIVKVLTIRKDGYVLFEEGGRLTTLHARSNNMIDATFDTTYADTPTQARVAFMVLPGGRMSVTDKDGSGQMVAAAYRRCPA